MTDFDVYAAIQHILDTTDLRGPEEIASKLVADLDVYQRAEAFVQTAEGTVSRYLTRSRNRRPDFPPIGGQPTTPAETAPDAAATDATAPDAPPWPASTPAPRAMPTKAARIREWWQLEIAKQYVGEDGWKPLAEFGVADHDFAAGQRRERAGAILSAADWHEACAHTMRTYKVEQFDRLPADVLEKLFKQRRPE